MAPKIIGVTVARNMQKIQVGVETITTMFINPKRCAALVEVATL
jgi:hypothetical protein